MFLDVQVISPKKVIFRGQAKCLIVPGEMGVFEVLPFHKRLFSRLISGTLVLDGQSYPVKRGIIKVNQNKVAVIIEES